MPRQARVFLTVAIPTYNRAQELSRQFSRLKELPRGDWQVLVSDNASIDDTKSVLKDALVDFPHPLKVMHQKSNLGFDANIEALFQSAESEYIWFLSDDDAIDDRTFTRTLNALLEYRPGLYVGHEVQFKNQVERQFRLLDLVPYNPAGIRFNQELGYTEFTVLEEDRRVALVNQSGQISTSIIRIEGLRQSTHPFGTGIHHLSYVNQAILTKPSVFVSPWPTVRIGVKKSFSRWFMDSAIKGVDLFFSHPESIVSSATKNLVVVQALKFAINLWGRSNLGLILTEDHMSEMDMIDAISNSTIPDSKKHSFLKRLRFWSIARKLGPAGRVIVVAWDKTRWLKNLILSAANRFDRSV